VGPQRVGLPPDADPLNAIVPPDHDRAAVLGEIAERAARSGMDHVHVLSWRDLDHPEAGGSEVHIDHLCADLAAAGLRVTLRTGAVPRGPEEVERRGYRVVRRGGRLGVFASGARDLRSGRLGPVDGLVEVFHGVPFFSPVWARSTPQVSIAHHVHLGMWHHVLPAPAAALGHLVERFATPLVYRRRQLVTISESAREEVVRAYKAPPEHVHVALLGVDPSFVPGGRRDPEPLVLGVARMMPQKRLPRLVAAFGEVRRHVPDARLVIVGDGPARGAVEAAVAAHGLGDVVTLTGHASDDDLVDWYRRAWVIGSASFREGFGLTLIEAAACGTPSVARRIAGHVDAVVDGVTGLLTDSADGGEEGLVAGLVRVLTDGALREELGRAALEHARRFRWERSAQVVLDALCDDADRRRR
jgi:glycosyltransferase involved in cell wall biosynthesis